MERVPTGIDGFDELVESGLPKGRCTLLCGGPGSGKTTFVIQFLVNGIEKHGESGVFVPLADDPAQTKDDMKRFEWDFEKLEKESKLTVVDLSPMICLTREQFKKAVFGVQPPKFIVEGISESVKNQVKTLKAKRVVVDSFTSFMIHEPDLAERRREIAHLVKALTETGCTCLVTSEVRAASLEREFQVEEYLAQGVILLETITKQDTVLRAIQVEKMRGTAHDTQPHPYAITERGIKVFPKEKIL